MTENSKERLLVVPIGTPGDIKKTEIYGAINFQLYSIFGDKVSFLDFDEEFGLYKLLSGNSDLIKDGSWYCSGYKELKERHMEMLSYMDSVLIYGMQVKGPDEGYTRNLPKMHSIEYINMELDKCHRKDDYGFVNFGTKNKLKNVLSRMIFIECLSESDVNVFHYAVDPRELDLSSYIEKSRYHRIGALKSNVGPSKPMPFFEWGMENTYIQELGKNYDFYYVGSVIFKDRFRLRDIVSKFNNCLDRRKFSSDGFKNVLKGGAYLIMDNKNGSAKDISTVPQQEYYYKLMISRYTFVNKPFLETEFNYQRFMEAIILGCIPFIDDKMNLDNLRLTYPEFYDIIIKNKLIIDTEASSYKDIADRMRNYKENGDSELIEKFKSTRAYKALTNEEKIKECWRKKLRWKDV